MSFSVDAADIFGDADDISSEEEKEKEEDSDKEEVRRSRSRSRSRSDDEGRRSRSGDEAEQRPVIPDVSVINIFLHLILLLIKLFRMKTKKMNQNLYQKLE